MKIDEETMENNIQQAFDVISGATYYGPAFREMLRRDKDARKAAIMLIQCIQRNDRLMECLSK